MKTEQYTELSYDEVDKLINSYFPKLEFNFVAAEELSNDVSKTFGPI